MLMRINIILILFLYVITYIHCEIGAHPFNLNVQIFTSSVLIDS